jgi:hypothetical protein
MLSLAAMANMCQILMKLESPRNIYEKYSDKKFMKVLPMEADLFHRNSTLNILLIKSIYEYIKA